MSYASQTADLTRTPVTLVKMTLDACTLTYGVGACTAAGAAGSECYNTYPTCQVKTVYDLGTKVYKFQTADAPLAVSDARPYLDTIDWLATEIKPGKLTVKGRVTLTFIDEPDTDVGIDPYAATRTSIQGTFWKKLLARNPNYAGRRVEIYQGYVGLAENDFVLRWAGNLSTMKLSRGKVRVEVVDDLQSLDDISVPPKLKIETAAGITDTSNSITVTDGDVLPATGYIRIEDEIIYYGSKSGTVLSSCTRGMFGTTAATHDAETKVEPVVYYAPDNPFTIMEAMLSNASDFATASNPGAGIAAGRIDSTAFADTKAFPGDEMDVTAVIVKPVKLSKLMFELADLCDCSVWVNEAQKVTIRRNNVPNRGGRSYIQISDDYNIIERSGSVDLNEESRKSRIVLYWDKNALDDDEKPESYNSIEVVLDADAESVNEYNGIAEHTIYTRWLRRSWGAYAEIEALRNFAQNQAARRLANCRDAQTIISFSVEMKDEGILVGDYVEIETDEVQAITGADSTGRYSIWKRDAKDGKVALSAVKIRNRKIGIIAADTLTNEFTAATNAELEYGFIADATTKLFSDGSDAYRIY